MFQDNGNRKGISERSAERPACVGMGAPCGQAEHQILVAVPVVLATNRKIPILRRVRFRERVLDLSIGVFSFAREEGNLSYNFRAVGPRPGALPVLVFG